MCHGVAEIECSDLPEERLLRLQVTRLGEGVSNQSQMQLHPSLPRLAGASNGIEDSLLLAECARKEDLEGGSAFQRAGTTRQGRYIYTQWVHQDLVLWASQAPQVVGHVGSQSEDPSRAGKKLRVVIAPILST